MSTVQNAAITPGASTNTAAATGTAKAAGLSSTDAQDRFLKLLVTQMQNQDPLNPLDNAQVTTQLAQLSTVSGISQLNDTLQALSASFTATQTMQAAAMIGRGVMVAGSQVDLAGGQAVFGAQLAQPVDRLVVSILDQAGNVVHRADAGPQQAGIVALQWDGATDAGGKANDGSYRVSLTATSGGKAAPADALTIRKVISVTTGSGGALLNLYGTGSVQLADVKQII